MTLKLRKRRLVQDAQQGREGMAPQPADLPEGAGIIVGLLLSVPLWIVIGVVTWMAYRVWK
jgi:hypothetical protein